MFPLTTETCYQTKEEKTLKDVEINEKALNPHRRCRTHTLPPAVKKVIVA